MKASIRIVAVDDDEPNLALYRLLLERYLHGCTLVSFTDPVEALAYCRSGQADAAVIDFDMPRLNGVELAQALHACEIHRALPIVMVSAHLDENLRRRARHAGVTGFVDKPFQRDALLSAVTSALSA